MTVGHHFHLAEGPDFWWSYLVHTLFYNEAPLIGILLHTTTLQHTESDLESCCNTQKNLFKCFLIIIATLFWCPKYKKKFYILIIAVSLSLMIFIFLN